MINVIVFAVVRAIVKKVTFLFLMRVKCFARWDVGRMTKRSQARNVLMPTFKIILKLVRCHCSL